MILTVQSNGLARRFKNYCEFALQFKICFCESLEVVECSLTFFVSNPKLSEFAHQFHVAYRCELI
ncbi:hypothetical protein AS889_16745 [Pseudomonas putida]|nr:hypothetical protein AS889_16745 [Pseudomonas putida]